MRLSFLRYTEIVKLNACEIFCNHQISKLNTAKCNFFPIGKLSACEI